MDRKIIGLSVVYWADEWFFDCVDSVIDFVDELIIWHNYYPYTTSSEPRDEVQHEKVLKIIEKIRQKYGDKIKYILNKKSYTSAGITDLINKDLLLDQYSNEDMIMYIDTDEIFIPEQLKKIRKLVLSGKYDQYKIFQKHYIKYSDLWMPCPTNPYQTFITKNVYKPSYIRNHKDLKTLTLPDDFFYKHMAYCQKDWNDLKKKLMNTVNCEHGITIDVDWYENVFLKITHDNYHEFKNFSYIKEFPHHMPFINKE